MIFARHIEAVRQQPEHVRKQVALGSATVLTALIAVVWLGVSLASGTFAIRGTSFAEANAPLPPTVTENKPSNFFAAAAAALGGGKGGPAHVEVVSDVKTEAAVSKTEPTVIPF